MRLTRDKLVFLSLALLMRAQEDARSAPIQPGLEVRLALAVLFSFSRSREREHYDRFWRNLSQAYPESYSGTMANTFRMNEGHGCIEWISRDVGASSHIGYRAKLKDAARRSARGIVPPSPAKPGTDEAVRR